MVSTVGVQTKQWPLAPNLRDSLITHMNVSRQVTFFQKWPLANVGKSGESEQNRLANDGEYGESEQNRLANVGESSEYLPTLGKCWHMIRKVILSTNNIFYMFKMI